MWRLTNEISKRNFDICIVGAGGYSLPICNFVKSIGKNALNMFFGNAALKSGAFGHNEIPNSLLTNQPVGQWHLTIGNPFSPIAVYGNLILEKTSIEWDDVLDRVKELNKKSKRAKRTQTVINNAAAIMEVWADEDGGIICYFGE
mgnify:CR=1 FL=1